jgi:hypothetical protein
METRLTLRPGQPGTKKLAIRYGERLLRVRYVYDEKMGRRLKTVELIVESVPWRPAKRRPRRRDDDIVALRIAYGEIDLRTRAKRLGAVWRPAQKMWEMSWLHAKRLGIAEAWNRSSSPAAVPICRHIAPSTGRCLHPLIDASRILRMRFNQ